MQFFQGPLYSKPLRPATVTSPMRKPLCASEVELFRKSVEDAEPLVTDRAEPFRYRPPPVPIVQPPKLSERPEHAVPAEAEIETGDYLLFSRSGVQKCLLADLQRGHLEIEWELDLHGLTVTDAERILGQFLGNCARRNVRCALIIHGKGRRSEGRPPVLKRKLNAWLRLYSQVFAFCSATRRDGGAGALYLLLRNPQKFQCGPAGR